MHVMKVIFLVISATLAGWPSVTMEALAVRVADLCVVRSRGRSGDLVVRVGVPLADVYLEFLGGRCRRTRCWRPRMT